MVERGNLYAISIESPLHERIAMAQLNHEEVQKIKQKLEEKDPKFDCFRREDKGIVWFGQRLVIPQDGNLRRRIWMRPISLNSPFIQEVPKCTETLGKIFGGQT
jgi:hypothetical protein